MQVFVLAVFALVSFSGLAGCTYTSSSHSLPTRELRDAALTLEDAGDQCRFEAVEERLRGHDRLVLTGRVACSRVTESVEVGEHVLLNVFNRSTDGGAQRPESSDLLVVYLPPGADWAARAATRDTVDSDTRFVAAGGLEKFQTYERHVAKGHFRADERTTGDGMAFVFRSRGEFPGVQEALAGASSRSAWIKGRYLSGEALGVLLADCGIADPPTGLDDLRRLAVCGNGRERVFPARRQESPGMEPGQQVQVHSAPEWLIVSVREEDRGFVLELAPKTPAVSFLNDFAHLDIPEGYRHLLRDMDTACSATLALAHDSGLATSVPVACFCAEAVLAEIHRLENLPVGYLRLTANQKDVAVFVDGRQVGVIGEAPVVARITEGSHRITARKELFGAKSIDVQVRADDAFAYHFELLPAGNLMEQVGSGRIVQSTGELVVLSQRNDLEVFIDGVRHVPPFKLPNIASGRYRLTVRGPGVDALVETTVEADAKTTLNLDKSGLY